jgi:hypothetical protein
MADWPHGTDELGASILSGPFLSDFGHNPLETAGNVSALIRILRHRKVEEFKSLAYVNMLYTSESEEPLLNRRVRTLQGNPQ